MNAPGCGTGNGGERGDTLGEVAGDLPSNGSPPVVADEINGCDVQRVENADHISYEMLTPVRLDPIGGGTGGVPALVHGQNAVAGVNQHRNDVSPRPRGLRETVEQQDRTVCGRPVVADSEGERAHGDLVHGRGSGSRGLGDGQLRHGCS